MSTNSYNLQNRTTKKGIGKASSNKLTSENNPIKPNKNILEPTKKREIKLYSEDVIGSKRIVNTPEDFTNFLNNECVTQFKNEINPYIGRLEKIYSDLNESRSVGTVPNHERIKKILGLYLNNEDKERLDIAVDIKNGEFNEILKIKPRAMDGQLSTSLRLFILLKNNTYQVILIDPLHLVIPSKVQRDQDIYKNNKGNGASMEKSIKELRDLR